MWRWSRRRSICRSSSRTAETEQVKDRRPARVGALGHHDISSLDLAELARGAHHLDQAALEAGMALARQRLQDVWA